MFLALALQATLAQQLAAKLDPIEQSGTLVAAQVITLDGTVLYEKNPAQRVMPASNQKLFSCIFALNQLGLDYQSQTRFWKQGTQIIVDAPGQPSLSYEELTAAAKKLGKAETVAVKQPYKSGYPPDWELDDMPNRYAAPVSAFTVDQGAFELWSQNGKAILKPTSYGVKVVTLGGKESRIDYDPFARIVRVYGPIPKENARMDTLAIGKPDAAAASLFGGIPIPYTQNLPTTPALHAITAPPLKEVLKTCLQKSDNNMAESLMLMGATKELPFEKGPYPEGPERMKKFFVESVGVDKNDLRPIDGSGMSRHNLVTVRAIVKSLLWAHTQWGEDWKNLLAVPGKGTLGSRLEGSTIRAKTGTLDSVSSLSGYVKAKDGQELVFSLVFNHYVGSSAEIRAVQDEVVRIMESFSVGTVFDGGVCREVSVPVPSYRLVHGHRPD